jgi:2'-5' RNA ligase
MPTSPPSALLVEIPEAEPLVGEHRLRFDPVAARGVPAHVTTIYPFAARDDLDDVTLARVAAIASAQEAFDYRFSSTAWFDRDVLYLAPDDPAPFSDLTAAVVGEFPEHPPYAGEYEDLAPHLTVAHATTFADLDAVEAQLRTGLPFTGRAEHLSLLTEDAEGRWTVLRRFPFGA